MLRFLTNVLQSLRAVLKDRFLCIVQYNRENVLSVFHLMFLEEKVSHFLKSIPKANPFLLNEFSYIESAYCSEYKNTRYYLVITATELKVMLTNPKNIHCSVDIHGIQYFKMGPTKVL